MISGNGGFGLAIYISANTVQGNYLGVGADGATPLGNSRGVYIGRHGTVDNVIGGTDPAARNIISGNRNDGITLTAGPTNTRVEGNYIGTNALGTLAVPNARGLAAEGSSNTIGGTATGAGNLISGNTGAGVSITGSSNVFQGNRVGTTVSGSALGNGSHGFSVEGGNNTIGGSAAGPVISSPSTPAMASGSIPASARRSAAMRSTPTSAWALT